MKIKNLSPLYYINLENTYSMVDLYFFSNSNFFIIKIFQANKLSVEKDTYLRKFGKKDFLTWMFFNNYAILMGY